MAVTAKNAKKRLIPRKARNGYDWASIKAFYLKGAMLKDICAKFGCNHSTLARKIGDKGWNTEKAGLQTLVSDRLASSTVRSIAMKGGKFMDEHQSDAEQSLNSMQVLRDQGVSTLDDWQKYEQIMTSNLKRGRIAFGLDKEENKAKSLVNITIMGRSDEVVVSQGGSDIVDVEPEPNK